VPEPTPRSHAYLAALPHDPGRRRRRVGRSVEDDGHTFSMLDERVAVGSVEERLDELPATTRVQRWALRPCATTCGACAASWPSARCREAQGAAVDRIAESRAEAIRRLEGRCARGGGSADLAGLALMLRQLRALAG
jgi:glutamate dehydrogenase